MSDFFEEIGELREYLLSLDVPDALIFIDGKAPTALSSYRGIYRDLAIECDVWGSATPNPGHDETKLDKYDPINDGSYMPGARAVRIRRDPTVAEFIKALNMALGEEFEGYKGGQFPMSTSSDIWVSEYGDADSRRLFKVVTVAADRVDFKTYVVP